MRACHESINLHDQLMNDLMRETIPAGLDHMTPLLEFDFSDLEAYLNVE